MSFVEPAHGVVDLDLLAETALAVAQATIQNAVDGAILSRAELARRMGCRRSYVSRILRGDHNLTIKTMARALGACGQQLNFGASEPQCTWSTQHRRNVFESENDSSTSSVAIEQLLLAA